MTGNKILSPAEQAALNAMTPEQYCTYIAGDREPRNKGLADITLTPEEKARLAQTRTAHANHQLAGDYRRLLTKQL